MRRVFCDKCKKEITEAGFSWMFMNCLMHVGWELPKMIPNFELCEHCNDEVLLTIEGTKNRTMEEINKKVG